MSLVGIVMAAGKGSRMRSRIPKPLHRICGKEMIRYPVELLKDAGANAVLVVVSPDNRDAIERVLGETVQYAVQDRPDGTGGALRSCVDLLNDTAENVLVIGADTALVILDSISDLLEQHTKLAASMTLLTAPNAGMPDLGRVLEADERVTAIVESANADGFPGAADADVNAGVYCFDARWLREATRDLRPRNSGEIYLTDLAEMAASTGVGAYAVPLSDPAEAWGVNNRSQLAIAETVIRDRIREHWMLAGVTMTDPGSVYIDADVSIGMDTIILPNTMVTGRTTIGENCEIGPNSVIRDSTIGNSCRVTSSALEEATMEDATDIGPFSHLRPGAYLESGVHIGNYVEVKESRLKAGAVMGHFGYAGDATIGERVNVGAGMITCNYDGKDKHRTVVEDDAFIGCDTMLVAPVTVGKGSITGAGAVVTRDVPPARLAVGVPATIKRTLK